MNEDDYRASDSTFVAGSREQLDKAPETANFGESLSEFLNSDSYIDYLRRYGYDIDGVSKLIGVTLEYRLLHPDLFNIDVFLEDIKTSGHFGADKAFTSSIAAKLGVDPDSQEGKERIFSYYYDRAINNGVYYHGFNGAFEDDIRREGLSP